MIEKNIFGTLSDGRDVTKYTIKNNCDEYVELLDFGASIHSLFVKDRYGNIGDVVLGVTEADELTGRTMEGAVMGRVGNRIAYGKCVLDGKEVQLETNHGGHLLHSGSGNYAARIFDAKINDNGKTVSFYYRDKGDGGFGNEVDAWVHYTFDDDHRLEIKYELTPEETTVLSPTNHAYFNLSDFGDIGEEILTIYSKNLAKKGNGVPVGGLQPVVGTPADFTSPRSIKEAMASDEIGFFQEGRVGFDDFYVLDKKGYGLAAELYSPATGRRMKTYTDMQSVILYTPGNCSSKPGKRGVIYSEYAAVCIETQFVPNAVNCPEFESPVFGKGEKLETVTVYEFSVDE